jgi:spore protease
MLSYCKVKDNDTCLIIGIGNSKIISDALGSKTIENIIVTRHMYLINNVDNKRYRNVSVLEPNVLGVTGIDSFEIIKNVVKEIKPNFVIAIDSLCARTIERLNCTIQITSTGITPGSGIGNSKEELSFSTLNVPVIAIGVPTVVEASVIVADTINYLLKKIGYMKENVNNLKDKLKPVHKINYLNSISELSPEEKREVLGYIGMLSDDDLKTLIWEVLSPINANMIVTTKEIDFIIEKLGKLISEGINKTLHHFD